MNRNQKKTLKLSEKIALKQSPEPRLTKKAVGRGSVSNENHRFTSERFEIDGDYYDGLVQTSRLAQDPVASDISRDKLQFISPEELPILKTEFFFDNSKTIISENKSPDIGFRYSLNLYRGCEHGCTYCYARPTHEYLNLSAGNDFESKIFVKKTGPALLRDHFMKKSWAPELVVMSGVTDCYQPAERQFGLTRQCLEVFLDFRNPVAIITKNALVTRDLDLLSQLNEFQAIHVTVSITSLDASLTRRLEPRTSVPEARLRTVETLAKAGIPVSVNAAPMIPGLTDHELPKILEAAAQAGARSAGYTPVRLPYSVKDLFSEWLDTHFPEKKEKVLSAIRSIRENQLNNAEFGSRMRGSGPYADNMKKMFQIFSAKYGLNDNFPSLSTDHFRRPQPPTDQISFFD